jgi:hypothetical protein
LEVEEGKTCYRAKFDADYGVTKPSLPPLELKTKADVEKWCDEFPRLKHIMDIYFSKEHKSEREFQQLVVRDNNRSLVSNSTDYFIVDVEYAFNKSRFDMVAIKWSHSERKKENRCRLALIEMKYGYKALGGKAGIVKHFEDIEKLEDSEIETIKDNAITQFRQLRCLDLIQFGEKGNPHQINKLTDDKLEIIFLLANYVPHSTRLETDLSSIKVSLSKAEVKFATASFMGYGLYESHILTFKDFMMKYIKEQ